MNLGEMRMDRDCFSWMCSEFGSLNGCLKPGLVWGPKPHKKVLKFSGHRNCGAPMAFLGRKKNKKNECKGNC